MLTKCQLFLTELAVQSLIRIETKVFLTTKFTDKKKTESRNYFLGPYMKDVQNL
jgi:hypothetical protein